MNAGIFPMNEGGMGIRQMVKGRMIFVSVRWTVIECTRKTGDWKRALPGNTKTGFTWKMDTGEWSRG
ncbi:hypothetical protein EYV94_03060 [Puteibacter caeruleilacunae]|nr:hypothetical protein EYV94_03060 [Puteibacter caeruleilacunae]